MSSPVKEDLPRLADQITAEIVGEHALKPTETHEKIVLPNAEGILFSYKPIQTYIFIF